MQTDLVTKILATIGKAKVMSLSQVLAGKADPAEIIALTFYPDKGVAFRAAWLMENMFLINPEAFIPEFENLISQLKYVTNPSCKRHYAKIIMHLTSPGMPVSVRQKVREIDLEPAIEKCFDWLIDPVVLVAVKSFACEALFNMRHRYPWIAEELYNQLEYLMRDGTAAIQSKGRRLLSYLSPERSVR